MYTPPNCLTRRPASKSASLGLGLATLLLAGLASAAHAQVTAYTDEGTFNAVTASLPSITETYEGIAPAGGEVTNVASLPSGYGVGPNINVADGAAGNGHLSLNGSASYYQGGDGINNITVAFTSSTPMTAFGTNLGSLSPYGGDLVYGYNANGVMTTYDYPLTDTIQVTLCQSVGGSFSPSNPVGDPIQFGTVANGFVGVTSTTPFHCVIITQVKHGYGTLKDGEGYALPNPYYLVLDNTRFAQPPTLPTVTVAGSSPDANAGTGQVGDFVVTLSAAAATDLIINYTVKGSAKPGVDYAALKGSVKIKAGKTSKKIAVVPEGDLGGAGKKVVKLTLQPGTGYLVGTPDPVKVKITDTHVIVLP